MGPEHRDRALEMFHSWTDTALEMFHSLTGACLVTQPAISLTGRLGWPRQT